MLCHIRCTYTASLSGRAVNSAGLLFWWKFVLELLLFVIQGLNSRRDCSHTWVLFWPLFLFPLAESADLPGASLNSHQPSTFLGRCSCKNQPFCSGLFGPQKTDVLQKCHTLRVTHHFQVLSSSLKEKKRYQYFLDRAKENLLEIIESFEGSQIYKLITWEESGKS